MMHAQSLAQVDVVIPTRNRGALIEAAITSILASDYTAFTLWVVDQSDNDATEQTVLGFARADSRVRYLRLASRGISAARNSSVASNAASFILFTDDDCRVTAGWIGALVAELSQPGVAAIFGRVLPERSEPPPGAQVSPSITMATKTATTRTVYQGNRFNLGFGHGANMAFRRATLDQLDGFDTALDVGTPSGGGGDLDMFHRVMAAGLTFHYEPTALVWHQHRRDMAGLRKQTENNGRAFGTYLLKVWQRRSAPRRATLAFTYTWIRHYLLPQVFRSVRRKHTLPVWLTLAELRGALDAPRAFRATYANDRRVRQAGMWTGTVAQRSQ